MEQRVRSESGHPIRVVLIRDGKRILAEVWWGLIPYYTKDARPKIRPAVIRSESIITNDFSKAAVQYRRCIVPMSEFLTVGKDAAGKPTQYRVCLLDNSLFAVAGIWELWMSPKKQRIETGAIITVPANLAVNSVNHRMPAILNKEAQERWLDHSASPQEAVKLLQPYSGSDLLVETYKAIQRNLFVINDPDDA